MSERTDFLSDCEDALSVVQSDAAGAGWVVAGVRLGRKTELGIGDARRILKGAQVRLDDALKALDRYDGTED